MLLLIISFPQIVHDDRCRVVVGVDGVLTYEVAGRLVEDIHGPGAARFGVIG